jgi:c-di-GMP-binding flagellar brake protein YcgR
MSAILARKHHRRAFRREVLLSCQVVRERDFKLISELALDLSTEGMLVSSKLAVLTGEPLLVSFRAPRSSRWIDARATVARVVHGRRPSDRGRCLGLVFEELDDASRGALFRQLRGLPPPESARSASLGVASA